MTTAKADGTNSETSSPPRTSSLVCLRRGEARRDMFGLHVDDGRFGVALDKVGVFLPSRLKSVTPAHEPVPIRNGRP